MIHILVAFIPTYILHVGDPHLSDSVSLGYSAQACTLIGST